MYIVTDEILMEVEPRSRKYYASLDDAEKAYFELLGQYGITRFGNGTSKSNIVYETKVGEFRLAITENSLSRHTITLKRIKLH